MGQRFNRVVLAAVLVASAASALGQKSVEIYIPIGQSPGLSGKHTLIARVQAQDAQRRTITVVEASGAVATVQTSEQTAIWLDRSKLKLPNRKGDFGDCRQDRTVEVKYRDNDARAAIAEWIKVQAPQ